MKTQTCTPIETPFSPKEELRLVQQELETARCHFNMAEDSDLIDCCIHQLTALEKTPELSAAAAPAFWGLISIPGSVTIGIRDAGFGCTGSGRIYFFFHLK